MKSRRLIRSKCSVGSARGHFSEDDVYFPHMLRDGAIATWSDIVPSLESVRENARPSIVNSFASFPYCVYSPAFAGNYGRSKATYLCLGDAKIGIVNAEGKTPSSLIFPLSEIDEIEMGTELLSSWIAFHVRGQRRAVFFNSVSKPYYTRFVDAFRSDRESKRSADSLLTPQELDHYLSDLKKHDFKYDTYPRVALENRHPSAIFYHPETQIHPSIFGARVISSYLLLTASWILYAFSEARIIRYAHTANYSMVIRYIPLDADLKLHQAGAKEDYAIHLYEKSSTRLLEIPVAPAQSATFSEFCQKSGIS